MSLLTIIYTAFIEAQVHEVLQNKEVSSFIARSLCSVPKEASTCLYIRTPCRQMMPWKDNKKHQQIRDFSKLQSQDIRSTARQRHILPSPFAPLAGNCTLSRAHNLDCIPIIFKCCGAKITHAAIKQIQAYH